MGDPIVVDKFATIDDTDVHSDDDEDQSITNWRHEARVFRAKHENRPPYLRIPFGPGHSWDNPRTIIFFFHYRVFRPWCAWKADVMFVNNFLAMITAIIALINPDNETNSAIGGLSLFGGSLLLHSWYGYMQYSEADIFDLNPVSNNGRLESIRQDLAAMIHGGDITQQDQTTQTLLTLPFIASNTIGRMLSGVVLFLMAQCLCGDGAAESRFIQRIIYSMSLVLGCLTWPIVFSLARSPVLKVLSSFALFANEELYASYLFRKTPKEFCQGYLMALLGDFFPLDDLPLGLDDVLDDGLEDLEDVPGVEALQKLKEDQQNQTQAEQDLQERIDEAVEETKDFFDKEDDPKQNRSSSRTGIFGFWRGRSSTTTSGTTDADATETSDSNAAFGSVLGQAPVPDLAMPPLDDSEEPMPTEKSTQRDSVSEEVTEQAPSAVTPPVPAAAPTTTTAAPPTDSLDATSTEASGAVQDVHPELVFSSDRPDPLLVVSVPIRESDTAAALEPNGTRTDSAVSSRTDKPNKTKKKKKKASKKSSKKETKDASDSV